MFIQDLLSNPLTAVVTLASIVLAITVHEYSHALAATKLGDDTPRLMGRLTLDPTAHIDPIGGLLFLIIGFGWGKPVQYNPLRLRQKIDELWIALAGPASNLIVALIINLIILGIIHLVGSGMSDKLAIFLVLLKNVAYINTILAAFNLLPLPPLDGSSIVAYFLPAWRSVVASQLGLVILLLLIFPVFGGGNVLGSIMTPIITFFQKITLAGLI